jgi:hypothetical protein
VHINKAGVGASQRDLRGTAGCDGGAGQRKAALSFRCTTHQLIESTIADRIMGVLQSRIKDYRTRMHTKYLASVIFVHINKTGGSSIEKALGLPFQHRTAREIHDLIGAKRWQSRFSFTFIRNPWDKVASHYHYRVKTNQTGLRDQPIPFAEWVRLAYGENARPYYDNPKMFMPQMDWIAGQDGRIMVDFVGRFESLHADFKVVCDKVGIEATLPHLKQTKRSDYRKYYDDATAAIVAHWFAKDIDVFSYRFDQQ